MNSTAIINAATVKKINIANRFILYRVWLYVIKMQNEEKGCILPQSSSIPESKHLFTISNNKLKKLSRTSEQPFKLNICNKLLLFLTC